MKKANLIIRIVIAVGIGIYLVRFMFANGEPDSGTKLMGLGLALGYGAVLFLLFGWSFMCAVAEKFTNLYMPQDQNFRVLPEYSLAEARRKACDYAGAIAEYRQVIAKWPDDVFAHIQIADIAVTQLHDLQLAELELLSATAKAAAATTIALTHNRLADFYQFHRQDVPQAMAVIEQMRAKLPGTKAAARAGDRLAALQKILGGELPVPAPDKIQPRVADAATISQRRGF